LSTCGKRIDAAEEVILFSSLSPCDDDEEEEEEDARTSEDVRSARNTSNRRVKRRFLRR
jgi:hypothetical protein